MKLIKYLQSQGFGSRKECELIIKRKGITINGDTCVKKDQKVDVDCDEVAFNGEPIHYCEQVYIALNKPAGYECSHKPQSHRSIFELLPDQLLNRSVEPAGRLDVDTTGLLLLSDDGTFVHQMTSPKKELQKIYKVTLKHAATDEFIQTLRDGVVLHGSSDRVHSSLVEQVDDHTILLGITSGKYHQVKRMVAAASNRVEALHRTQIGAYCLDETAISEGEFIYLTKTELAQTMNREIA